MSHIALIGHASGTGTLTFAAPNTSTDRTLTLPDATGTLATAESVAAAGYTTSAGVLAQFSATGSAPVYACRAWVNFNGTGTVAIRASGNVSSITDNGTGNYIVNFTTAMPDGNYAVDASTWQAVSTSGVGENIYSLGPSGFVLQTYENNISTDPNTVYLSIFR